MRATATNTTFSDLLNSLCALRSDWAVLELGEDCELSFQRSDRAFLHFVAEGSLTLRDEESAQGARLPAGSFAIILDGRKHALHEGRGLRRFAADHFAEDHTLDCPPVLAFGGLTASRVFSATFAFSHAGGEAIAKGLSPVLCVTNADYARGGQRAFPLDPAAVGHAAAGAGGMAFLGSVADMLLVQAIRAAAEGVWPSAESAAEILGTPQIGTALRLMDTQPGRNWSVSSLAAEVGMSRSAFAAHFRDSVGNSPMQYLAKLRIEQSARLLRSSTCSIAKIAQDVGYDSVSSFARAFKKRFDATPGAYRRSLRDAARHARRNPNRSTSPRSLSLLEETP